MKSTGTLVALIAIFGAVGCGDADPPTDDGSHRGELRIYRVSYDDGRVEREFYLSPDARSSEVTKLIFPADPELAPWTRLKVWGEMEGEQLRVSRYAIDPEAEAEDGTKTSADALLGAPQRTRTVGFVLADVGGGVNISAADAQTTIFGTRNGDPGLWEYYLDASYGTLRFTGEVLGPTNVTDLGSCDTASVVRIENRWASTFGKTFNHWMTYIGSRYSNCGWGGIGGEGTAARPAYGSWYNASTGCVVLAQEIGHNLGLNHAGTMDCGTSTIMPDDPRNGCTGTEYGNRYTPMGGGCLHMNAYEKWYEGFMGGCNGVKVRSSGTFTLLPIALACNGVQALQIPMAKQRAFRNTSGSRDVMLNYYYLELRTRQGMDDRGNNGPVTQPTVLVHVVGDVPQPSIVSTFTWQLDMVPSTNPFDGMAAGQTFTDPAGGVSFTVQALSAERATINVNLQNGTGTNTCIDGSTFAAPGPDSCGMGGSSGSGGTGGASGSGGTAGTGGSGGTGGSSGTGGTSGTNGASGSSGTSGASGSGGTNGASGTSGSNGSGGMSGSGASGTGGASGMGGTTGGSGGSGTSGGNAGVGGDGATAGVAGSGAAAAGGSNAAGTSGTTSAGGTRSRPTNPVEVNEDEGSCACRTADRRSNAWGLLLVPLLGMLGWRRRATR